MNNPSRISPPGGLRRIVPATGLLLALAFLAAAPPAVAQTTYWLRGGTNAGLATPSNWALDADNTTTSTVVPGTNDVLVIGITARNDIPINRLTMGNANRAFGSIVLSNSGDNYILRISDTGTTNNNFVALTLLNGITNSAVAGNFYIGDEGRNVNLRLGNTDEDFAIANESSSSVTFQQRVELASTTSSNRTMVVSGAGSGTTFFQGGIANGGTGGAVLSLRIDTAGTVSIGTSTSGSFSGGTTLAAGTMAVNGTDVLGTGGLSINGGTIAATGAARSLTNSITVGGNFALGGLGQALTLSGPINLGGASRTVTVNGSDLTSWSGTVSDGALVKAGSGTLTLSAANSFAGGVTISDGMLGVANNSALGSGTLTIGGGALSATVTQRTLANNIVVQNDFTLGGLGQGIILNGGLDLGGTTRTVSLINSVTVGGVISNGGLIIANSATNRNITITNAATFTGGMTVLGGIFTLRDGGSLATDSALDLSATTTNVVLNINNLTASGLTLGSLAGGSAATVNLGDKTLTLSGNDTDTTFAGVIAGTGGLVKSGTGTLVLQGTSTFGGGVTLESGTLGVRTSAGALGTGTLTINGGTLASAIVPRTVANNISAGGNFALGGLANTITLSGDVDLNGQTRTITLNNSATIAGVVSNGSVLLDNPDPTRFLELTAANTFTNATVNGGILRLSGSGSFQSSGAVDLEGSRGVATFDIAGITAGAVTIGSLTGAANAAVLLGGKELAVGGNNGSTIFAGDISGAAQAVLRKTGTGTLELSGENTLAGALIVEAGAVRLNTAGGVAAAAISSISVGSGASLLISQSDQVNNAVTVSLSGGTIVRGAGVSEVFGDLSLTGSGFLDFGSGATGTLSFGAYTPSSLLTVQNFFPGNKLTFTSNLADDIGNTGLFSFQGDFNSDWDGSTFTITAIPEPSTYLAMAGLLALFLWPSRRRLLKDARSILGLRAPMHDRLGAK